MDYETVFVAAFQPLVVGGRGVLLVGGGGEGVSLTGVATLMDDVRFVTWMPSFCWHLSVRNFWMTRVPHADHLAAKVGPLFFGVQVVHG